MLPTLVVLAGATAVGKTALSLALAERLDTEILSADSRQFYRQMAIGTAKPSPSDLACVPHHFVDFLPIAERYTVADFEREALSVLSDLFQKKQYALLVGGSGLFIKALCEGLDQMPEVPLSFRQDLMQLLENEGVEALLEELKTSDPLYFEQVDKANGQRVVRALEVIRATGQPFSSFRTQEKKTRPFRIVKIMLDRPRPMLYARIEARVEQMLELGLEQEVRELYPFRHLNALQTVGYQEFFPYFEGLTDFAQTVAQIKQNTRRYAKRQLTWFRKDADFLWLDIEGKSQDWVLGQIEKRIAAD
ncbi:tRNA (adenosine(37)-N6)-dimethylallyltransferase MiaA [Hugenholtzia roseola]|uniref:tRNA (adenosine(37)-N6)-dimethylallyltransferase MiaA n=1 Tax=Hugenholtzia roseola TaxID=1002 RepID=UPI000418BAE9|nr:tRNA (adenosine(37)-N6)-dimethylallyltransferase MiaA [Hugenholtzia roseola]